MRSLVWEELDKALAELPDEQCVVFELNELQNFSFKEISESTGIPVNDTPFSISGKDFTIYTRNCLMNKYFRPETLKRSPSAIKSSILITFSRHKERELPLKIRMFVNKVSNHLNNISTWTINKKIRKYFAKT